MHMITDMFHYHLTIEDAVTGKKVYQFASFSWVHSLAIMNGVKMYDMSWMNGSSDQLARCDAIVKLGWLRARVSKTLFHVDTKCALKNVTGDGSNKKVKGNV